MKTKRKEQKNVHILIEENSNNVFSYDYKSHVIKRTATSGQEAQQTCKWRLESGLEGILAKETAIFGRRWEIWASKYSLLH